MGEWTPDRTSRSTRRTRRSGWTRSRASTCGSCLRKSTACGAPTARSLEIVQRFQRFSATLARAGAAAPDAVFDGRIEASALRSEGFHAFALQVDGATLRLAGSAGGAPARTFVRARGGACP